mgnify:FL=1
MALDRNFGHSEKSYFTRDKNIVSAHVKINERDIDEFNEAEENQNTKRKTELDVNLIHFYIARCFASQ